MFLSSIIIHFYTALSRGYANNFEYYTQNNVNLCIIKNNMQENIHFQACLCRLCAKAGQDLMIFKYIIPLSNANCNTKSLHFQVF